MESTGARRFLQPALYFAAAALAHGLLFLIPGEWGKTGGETTRGIRVKVQGDARGIAASPRPATAASPPTASAVPSTPLRVDAAPGAPGGGGGTPGDAPGGAGGKESTGGPVAGDAPPTSEYGSYLARLKTEGVQGWARESAGKLRQGWKGSGKSGTGWGGGSGSGTGTGTGSGAGAGSGGGTGTGSGSGGFLDPRVRMVVTHYPLDANGNTIERQASNLESGFRQIPYPDRKFRKAEYTAGWWNVYLRLKTDKSGKVTENVVLKPSTDGPMEKVFIGQVKTEVAKWSFEKMEAEITVDVRFYVE